MLNPSSSEEEYEEEPFEDGNSDGLSIPSADLRSLSRSNDNLSVGASCSSSFGSGYQHQYPGPPQRFPKDQAQVRPCSPSPSLISVRDEVDKALPEEAIHKRRLQLYVFVIRCIALKFTTKDSPKEIDRRQFKISVEQFQKIKDRFQAFFNRELNIQYDEAFSNAISSYFETVLKSDLILNLVKTGGCSAEDFRAIFKNNIEKRVKNLPEIDGLSKDTVLNSWMMKFDQIFRGDEDSRQQSQSSMNHAVKEYNPTNDQLYEMFQNILGVKKYEHTILFNAMQVGTFVFKLSRTINSIDDVFMLQLDNHDEQAAQIRRELDRQEQIHRDLTMV